MAVNALEGSSLPAVSAGKEAPIVVPTPSPAPLLPAPKPLPAKKTVSQTLADLEAQI